MKHSHFETPSGTIHYWISKQRAHEGCLGRERSNEECIDKEYSHEERPDEARTSAPWLVFLPGLTADHHLFDPQIEYFKQSYNCFVWDPPHHGQSRPFSQKFTLSLCIETLSALFQKEAIENPILIGQSMGGYVSQFYMDASPHAVQAFISIDSAPLQRSYYTAAEIGALKHTYPMFKAIPWKLLIAWGARGCATTQEGQEYMAHLINTYHKEEYCRLSADGFQALAEAVELEQPYRIDCPALLICGEQDAAGSTKRYNKAWNKRGRIPLALVAGAGHNSTLDRPHAINQTIERFVQSLNN